MPHEHQRLKLPQSKSRLRTNGYCKQYGPVAARRTSERNCCSRMAGAAQSQTAVLRKRWKPHTYFRSPKIGTTNCQMVFSCAPTCTLYSICSSFRLNKRRRQCGSLQDYYRTTVNSIVELSNSPKTPRGGQMLRGSNITLNNGKFAGNRPKADC